MSTIAPPKPPIDHNALPQDMNAFFMPFTPQRQYKQDPRMIVSARGMVYTDSRGHETLDCSAGLWCCLLYTSPSPRDVEESRMPSSA